MAWTRAGWVLAVALGSGWGCAPGGAGSPGVVRVARIPEGEVLARVRGERTARSRATTGKRILASTILDRLRKGLPIIYRQVIVEGVVDLSAVPALGRSGKGRTVRIRQAPFVCDRCVFLDGVTGPSGPAHLRFDGPVRLRRSVFRKGLRLASTTFRGPIDLSRAKVQCPTNFYTSYSRKDLATARRETCADFSGAVFHGPASFARAELTGGLFHRARFNGPVSFARAVLLGTTFFSAARFSGPASFARAEFRGEARFGPQPASGGGATGRVSPATAFHGPVTFRRARFLVGRSLRLARFTGRTDFSKVSPPGAVPPRRGAPAGK